MPALILIGVILWAVFGSPKKDVANLIWPDSPAPWETVDAFYYPNRHNLSTFETVRGLASLDGCRAWVRGAAAVRGDHGVVRGDYECGIGQTGTFMGLSVYRVTAR